uniref:Alcohol-forming fatty acyl-CoA reductase n=2 Tax=Opuntia streptacantha TaxID=393608 RepID=A0A7C9CTB6_OPUST
MVVNAIIVAMEAHTNQANVSIIYHIGSSVKNPVKLKVVHGIFYQYFTKHPWINKDGKPIVASYIKVLDSINSLNRYLTLRYLLPLKTHTWTGAGRSTTLCDYRTFTNPTCSAKPFMMIKTWRR